jgi:iron complex outermembrane receptor protein
MSSNGRLKLGRAAILTLPVIAGIPLSSFAQLEEVVVTATRRATDLQTTPISIQAFTAEDLELGGMDQGRDLGIMVPNVVLNPGVGGAQSSFYIRGLPGVGIYVDGVWQGGFGFQQTNFAEMERVEVLRGPQGTLFGRNTNGGAVNMITRRPADEFGARVNLDLGEFNRRDISLAVDLPISDTLKTKFMGAQYNSDGFIQGLSVPWDFGAQDDTLFRADVLWEPTDTFSLRVTANDEDKRGTDPRIMRFTNYGHSRSMATAIISGDPIYLDQARAVDPDWPDYPTYLEQQGLSPAFRVPQNGFSPQSHETNYPGGEVGKWQTRSDSMENGIIVDTKFLTLTADWDINENLNLEVILSEWEQDERQVVDFDGSEYIITTDDINEFHENETIEIHLTGSNRGGRINWIAGYYSLDEDEQRRFYRWGMYEFADPTIGPWTGPGPFEPQFAPATAYVRETAILAGLVSTGGPPITAFGTTPFNPLVFITDDALSSAHDEDEAFFGEVTFGVTEKLDMTLGVRISDKQGTDTTWTQIDAFRTADPLIRPQGDMYAGINPSVSVDPDLGTITTNKFALTYQLNDDLMLYTSWGEGFTQGGIDFVNNVGLVELKPEVIDTYEIGIRSDWLGGRLRFNGTYFDSNWDGMRVQNLFNDPTGGSLPFPYPTSDGLGEASGFEFDFVWLPTDRLQLTAGIGAIDTNYTFSGVFDGRDGIAPGSKFAYAPDNSAQIGVQYSMPMSNGGQITLVGNYGWMDDYTRDAAYQRNHVDADGNIVLEPSYGILNARLVYEPADRNYSVSLWGRNLTDELYINGGFDTRNVWGYDFAIVGRSREIGMSLGFQF